MEPRKTQNKIHRKLLIGFFVCLLLSAPLITQTPHATAQTPTAAAPAPGAPAASVHNGVQASQNAGDSTKISTTIGQFLGNLLLNIASIITWAGGQLLEYSMDKLIFGMGELLKSGTPLGNTIEGLWKTIRDICNLAFIFGFIYIGIRTILDNESSNTKRMLAQIIIAALLINFSLFFTKAIIDFSNILAISIKNSMVAGSGTISAHLGNLLGISGIFDSPSTSKFPTLTAAGNIWFYFMGAIFLLVAGFVLAAGGILLIIRFVMLVFIMIFSPILFGATIFPQTEKYAGDLWKKLISYSFFAPAYLLLLLFTMHILKAVTAVLNPTGKSLSQGLVQNPGKDSFSVILLFTIAIMFLIASLQISSKFSIAGANKVTGVGKLIQGYVGRRTVGRVANYATDKYEEFDARHKDSLTWKTIRTMAGGDRAIRGTLESAKKAKYGGSYSYKDDKDYAKEQSIRQNKVLENDKFIGKTKTGAKLVRDAQEASKNLPENERAAATKAARTKDEYIELQRAVLDASHAQLLTLLKKFEPGTEEYKAVVANMSHGQYEKLMDEKEEEFDSGKKGKLSTAREETIKESLEITEGNASGLAKASIAQIEKLGTKFLKENAEFLTATQMDDIKKSKKFVEQEFAAISKARDDAFKSIIETVDETERQKKIDAVFEKRKPKDVAKLPKEILTDKAATKNITPDIFGSVIDEKIDRTVQQKIYANVKQYLTNTDTATLSADDLQKFESMKQFMDTAFVQQRFEASRNNSNKADGSSEKPDFRSRGTKKRMGE